MQRITSASIIDLHDIAGTRQVEQTAAAALPPHTLMRRAGLAVARLAMAVAPHARTVWIACGPGNNGGDGLEAALQLRERGFAPVVTWLGNESDAPPDAQASFRRAQPGGVVFATAPPEHWDLAIDALLGIGAGRAPEGTMATWLQQMHAAPQPVLSVDVPSGLNAETGANAMREQSGCAYKTNAAARFCLSLLTLKPGLFTAQGRDAAGQVWFDDLEVGACNEAPIARLAGAVLPSHRLHASHKGSYGDVIVIGGAPGMVGAALLAGSAALHASAGRVLVGLLDPTAAMVDTSQPELMLRHAESLDLAEVTAVCGCGGGDALHALLPRVIMTAAALVLDADALNAIAIDSGLQQQLEARTRLGKPTVITPHPLEAARLLGTSATVVQADRLAAARTLSARFGVVVLKGSGTVIADAHSTPVINFTGNGRLATAGTGDVLAGMVGAALAAGRPAFDAAREAVWRHGDLADHWQTGVPLTAAALARA